MKKSPQQEKFEKMLQASKFSACGFMGDDKRSVWEIIDADAQKLVKAGKIKEDIAARMQGLTEKGASGLGNWVVISPALQVCTDDTRGTIPCPWPHNARCLKRITTLKRTDTGKIIKWSDLNIHLIKEHGFFQGKGSPFRLEPARLVEILF